MDSIVSGNSLETKNVFLRQKTPEFLMIYGEKIVLKKWSKNHDFWGLDFFRFFGPGVHISGPILLKSDLFWREDQMPSIYFNFSTLAALTAKISHAENGLSGIVQAVVTPI